MNHSMVSATPISSAEPPAIASRTLSALPLPRATRLDLLRGMLCRLEDVTPAGQQYLMAKVIPLLRREALDPGHRFGRGDLTVIARSLEDLEHEVSRVAPDPSTFSQKAHILVDVLTLA